MVLSLGTVYMGRPVFASALPWGLACSACQWYLHPRCLMGSVLFLITLVV